MLAKRGLAKRGLANITVEATHTTQRQHVYQFDSYFFKQCPIASCVPKGATHLLGTNISLKGFLKTEGSSPWPLSHHSKPLQEVSLCLV